VLVNNAGTGAMSTLEQGTMEDWRETLNVNVAAPALCAQEALRGMHDKAEVQLHAVDTAARPGAGHPALAPGPGPLIGCSSGLGTVGAWGDESFLTPTAQMHKHDDRLQQQCVD
jgi:NAD(P)-dependent dehydrogenase (short-subunit alcohol dehydrogenase family)